MEEVFEIYKIINKDPKDLSGRNLVPMGEVTTVNDKRVKRIDAEHELFYWRKVVCNGLQQNH